MKTLTKGLLAIVTLTLPVKATDALIEKTAEVYRKAVLAGDATAVAATYRADAVEMSRGRCRLRPVVGGRRAGGIAVRPPVPAAVARGDFRPQDHAGRRADPADP